jgi:hypothetical protein
VPPGCFYVAGISARRPPGQLDVDVLSRLKQRYPKHLDAPVKWGGESMSILENYVRTEKPATQRGAKP